MLTLGLPGIGQSRRSIYADAGSTGPEVTLPLGKGEFDEPIGLPLCVICQNVGASSTVVWSSKELI